MSSWEDMSGLGFIALAFWAAMRNLATARDEWRHRPPTNAFVPHPWPPRDWSDREDWNRYFREALPAYPARDRWHSGLAYSTLALS
jgi:hypothetical protein